MAPAGIRCVDEEDESPATANKRTGRWRLKGGSVRRRHPPFIGDPRPAAQQCLVGFRLLRAQARPPVQMGGQRPAFPVADRIFMAQLIGDADDGCQERRQGRAHGDVSEVRIEMYAFCSN